MSGSEDKARCGLPQWVPIPRNDTTSFLDDVVLCAVNVPFCAFAFLLNLVVIVAVIKTPSLQRPCNILLCSLAATDCLTGLIAQPIFVAWRFMIHRIHESCDHQAEMLQAFTVSQSAFAGWSFVNITLISFDRHYALAKPMVYHVSMTRKKAVMAVTIAGTTWLLFAILRNFILPELTGLMMDLVVGVFLFILPIVNHVGIFIAIRRHNKHVAGAVSRQDSSPLVRREKKVAIDMIIVVAVLLFCLVPIVVVNMFQDFLVNEFEVLYVWTAAILYLNSSINPVIYFVRRSEIRSAIRSMIHY